MPTNATPASQVLNDMAEAFHNRSKGLALREETLEKKRVNKYQSEYDGIRNHVGNSATPARNRFKSSAGHLKTLGANTINTIHQFNETS